MIRRWAQRVDAFWFAPTDPATLALVRIAFGALVILWTLSLAPDLGAFFSTAGVLGDAAARGGDGTWSLLWIDHSDIAVAAVYLALLAAATGVMTGWHSRVCAAVVFVALTSLARANPFVLNSGDTLIRVLAFYLMLAPSGMAFSLDRRRARHQGRTPALTHPAWPLRLIQIQVSVIYASAVWSKLQGASWRDGTAAAYATDLPDLERFPLGRMLARSPMLAELATYGTLMVEAGLVLGLWHRRTRVPALVAGVLLHLSIEASIRVGFFTLAVFVAYASFADPKAVRTVAAYLSRVTSRVAARVSPLSRRVAWNAAIERADTVHLSSAERSPRPRAAVAMPHATPVRVSVRSAAPAASAGAADPSPSASRAMAGLPAVETAGRRPHGGETSS